MDDNNEEDSKIIELTPQPKNLITPITISKPKPRLSLMIPKLEFTKKSENL